MLLLWAALACWASGFVAFYFDRYRIPFLIPLVLYLGAGSFSRENDHFFPSQKVEPPEQVTPGIALEKGEHDTVIVIAATGGGIQSAAWTGNVLAQLKEAFGDVPQFDRSVRLVSSVSGGSVGAMYFLHAYQNGVLPSGRKNCARALSSQRRHRVSTPSPGAGCSRTSCGRSSRSAGRRQVCLQTIVD